MKTNIIHNLDCLQGLSEIDSNSIDLICIDPPYLSTDLEFDKVGFDMLILKEQLKRVLKPNGYLVSFGSIELLADFCPDFKIRFSGIWLKQAPVMRTATAKKPMSKSEAYAVYTLPKAKISELTWNPIKNLGHEPYKITHRNSGYKRGGKDSLARANSSGWTIDGYVCENEGFRFQTDVIEGNNKTGMSHEERTLHPTQKPISVISTLIRWLSNENDLVLDCFMGSGTTAIAALRTSRNFIGFELDKEYCQIANERVAKELAQTKLF